MKTLGLEKDGVLFEYQFPGEWNDLTADQLIYLIRMIDKKVTAEEVKTKMLLYCINGSISNFTKERKGGSFYLLKIKKARFWLSPEELTAMSQSLDYLFSENEEGSRIDPKLTINPFPKAQCGCIAVYGPAEGLTDITYKQFSDLQIWATRVGESDEILNKFISIIYKRHSEEATPKLIAKMSPSVKTAIVWFYLGCLQMIQKRFPKVFAGGEASGNVVDGQMRIIDALAQNKLADKEKVKAALLYDALYTMECAAEQVDKINKK